MGKTVNTVHMQTLYKEYYESCPRITKANLYNFKLKENFVDLDTEDYLYYINCLAEQIRENIEGKLGTSNEHLCIKFHNIWELYGLQKMADFVCPLIENQIYGCPIVVNEVHIYKNLPCNQPDSSWLWHFDNCCEEKIKWLVYLSDVGEDNGSFEYLEKSNEPIKRKSTKYGPKIEKPLNGHFYNGISNYIDAGYHTKKTIGPTGTNILFNPNCVHRATSPTKEPYRTCMIFTFRPYHERAPYLDKKYTKEWDGDTKRFNIPY